MQLETDICIVGAGPGGAATALKLSYLGIPCVLVDKSSFPRDKVCGDAISGKVTTLLNRLDPAILNRFQAQADMQVSAWGIRFIAPNGKKLDVPFFAHEVPGDAPAPGYISRRMDFDHFLIQEVQKRESIQYFDHTAIETYEKTETGYLVKDKTGTFSVHCRLLVVANGAHSAFTRHVAGLNKDPKHHAAAVRAYFKNVGDMHPDNFLELHFIKEVVPGYFWVFPMANGYANVGVGMRSDHLSKKKINLRKTLLELVQEHPFLKERFQNASLEGDILGYSLPLGSKTRPISGDNFLLVGDAGHLVDPLTGEGIGNAFYSGFIAAELAEKCLAQNDFSAEFLKAYDVRVARVLGSEMKLSYQIQRMLRHTRLTNTIANFITNNNKLTGIISRMYTDFELRKRLVRPGFWIKLLLKKEA